MKSTLTARISTLCATLLYCFYWRTNCL